MLRVGDRDRLADPTGLSCSYLCLNTGQSRGAVREEDIFNSETRECDLPEEVAVCEDYYMGPFG